MEGWSSYLDDFGVNVTLLLGAIEDGLFDGPRSYQHQHQYCFLLPNAMRTIARLQNAHMTESGLRRAWQHISLEKAEEGCHIVAMIWGLPKR